MIGEKGSTEAALIAIWAEVLEVPDVTPDDDFMDFGGDSLLAMQIVARVEERWNLTLSLARLLENRTPRALGRVIDAETQ